MKIFIALVKTLGVIIGVIISCAIVLELSEYIFSHPYLLEVYGVVVFGLFVVCIGCTIFFYFYESDTNNES